MIPGIALAIIAASSMPGAGQWPQRARDVVMVECALNAYVDSADEPRRSERITSLCQCLADDIEKVMTAGEFLDMSSLPQEEALKSPKAVQIEAAIDKCMKRFSP